MRVRFAPSPTGFLHIGGLRTALYNYLLARKEGGAFVLRIEDTDRTRFVADAEQDILDSLKWAGITFDEGPGVGGKYGPYHQSERSELYASVAKQLIEADHAYIAFDTPEEIESMKERTRTDSNPNPRYDYVTRVEMTNSLTLTEQEVKTRMDSGAPFVVRLKVNPGQTVSFTDAIRGDVSFESETVDDQVLVKSDGLPTYHLANIVDDHKMGITHVIRGEEWLPSTPKHILLYQAMGWAAPQMAHLPLILSPTGGKLSKRNADKQGIPVSVAQYRETGYEPAALVNFLAMLGWNPGTETELFSMEELIQAFSLDRVGQAGVQFDLQKLKWFNEQYVRSRSSENLSAALLDEVQSRYGAIEATYLERAIELMRERLSFEKDLLEESYLFADPTSYDEGACKKRWKENSSPLLVDFANELSGLDSWDRNALETALKTFIADREVGMGAIMFPVRMTLTGMGSGPDLYGMMELFGREVVVRRLTAGASTLG